MSGEAGKGDTYRKVNLKAYNETLERLFGDRDPKDIQKCRKFKISDKDKK